MSAIEDFLDMKNTNLLSYPIDQHSIKLTWLFICYKLYP